MRRLRFSCCFSASSRRRRFDAAAISAPLAVLSLFAALPARAQLADFGGGPQTSPHPADRAPGGDCITPRERLLATRAIRKFETQKAAFTSVAPVDPPATPRPYPFYPIAGNLWQDLFINNFVDLDTSSPGILDWDNTNFTYDGHRGHDVALRSFYEQNYGVPIFAALDGTVVETHDGEFDRNTSFDTNAIGNHVILSHGNGHYTYYWHMRTGSVAVQNGQIVKAGQQLGLVGSSGYSTGPHLHFESWFNDTWYEPYAGPARPGPSFWVKQVPIRRDFYLHDFNITYRSLSGIPNLPYEMPKRGTFVQTAAGQVRTVALWSILVNLPANSTSQLRFYKPDGSVLYTGSVGSFNNTTAYRSSWWWWSYNFALPDVGTYQAELLVNGQSVGKMPFEVVPTPTDFVNRAPRALAGATFDPPLPRPDRDVVFCRVQTPLAGNDADYDTVRYRYEWTLNGVATRTITTAAYSDALPRDTAKPGDTLKCVVTPTDGLKDGPPTIVQARLPRWTVGRVAMGTATGDNKTRLLWNQPPGASVLSSLVGPTGVVESNTVYGPLTGWTVEGFAVGPDGKTRLGWMQGATGALGLWRLNAAGTVREAGYNFGPFAGETLAGMAVGTDNKELTLWRGVTDASRATLRRSLGATVQTTKTYGPVAGWTIRQVAVGADNKPRLFWTDTTGKAAIWTLNAATLAVESGATLGPVAGYTATDLAIGSDNKTRLLWTRTTDNAAAVWRVNGSTIEGSRVHPAPAGYAPQAISVGPDGKTRLLWSHNDGRAALWTLAEPTLIVESGKTYGPYY